jgi:hypothetical protein
MNKAEIQERIKRLKNGRAATSDAHQIELIDLGLSKYRKMLADLEKKSDPQLTGKTGQLEENQKEFFQKQVNEYREAGRNDLAEQVKRNLKNQLTDQEQAAKAFEDKGWGQVKQGLATPPQVAPKPTATIHFAGQQHPGQYTRGELWSDVRQNFKLVLLSATFRRCLNSGDYSELWSKVLFVKLWQGIHEGLKKLEGGKDYTMEELLIRHWAYGEDVKQAGRVLAEYLKQPKPE